MASFGIYDGTDDEPEDVRLARLAREAAEKELAEAAAAESQKFRDSNPFSDAVTTGADGGSGPITLDPFVVDGKFTAGDNSSNLFTNLGPTGLGLPNILRSSILGPATDVSQAIDFSNNPALAGAVGFPVQTPEEKETARLKAIQDAKIDAEIAADEALRAQAKAKRLNDLNPLGPIYTAVKSAVTGAWEIIRNPAQGLGNVATNIGQIFEPGADTNVIPLPIPAAVGAGITIAGLANPNDVTRATDNVNKAKAAAAQGRRDGVSEAEQADLDDDVEDMQGVLDYIKARSAPSQGAAGVVTAIGAAAAGGTAAGTGTGAGAGGAAAGGAAAGGAAAGATQTTTPTNVAVGGVFDQKTLDAVAAAQTQAQAIAAAQTTPPTNVVTPAPINGADILRQTQVGLNPAPIFEQPGTTTTAPTDWTKANAAQAAAAQAGQTAQTQAIAGMGVATPTTTQQNPDGTFVVTPITPVTPPPVTPPPVTPPPCDPATQQLSTDGRTCVPKVIPVTPPPGTTCSGGKVKNAAGVCECPTGQSDNGSGVCIVAPVNPPPGTTTIDPTLILPIPSNPFTMSTITADQRDLPGELEKTAAAFKLRRNALRDVYGDALNDYTDADIAAFDKVSGAMRGTNAANTAAASAQTIAANRALRDANLADVNRLGGAALLNRQTLNSQLYGNLNQYSTEASAALGRDMDALRLAEAKQLSPEDIRNSQQAAREAWSARGLVNSRGAVGAEILNRDSLARQREAEARAKVQQSYGNLQQATAMEMANVFDPQAAILGGQYGMQTQNYGTNAALYGQAANQMAGSQNYVQKVFNPMGEYPNNIYDFNANATTAARISEANNAAAVAAAREAGQYGLAGAALKSGWVQDAATGLYRYVRSALGGS